MSTIKLTNELLMLEATPSLNGIELNVRFFNTPLTTKKLTHIIKILDQKLPRIFLNKCFNDLNLSFREEVLATPLGHLFEHILLEYLCDEMETGGFRHICVKGETEWNWNSNPINTYRISLSGPQVSQSQLIRALNQAIVLTDEILHPPVQPDPDMNAVPALVYTHEAADRLELFELNS